MSESWDRIMFSKVSPNSKINALESALEQTFKTFKDLVLEFNQLNVEAKSYQMQLKSQKEQCNSKTCKSADELTKIIESKDHIIQSVVSLLMSLYESKNFEIICDIFKIIYGEVTSLTPPCFESCKGDDKLPEGCVSPRRTIEGNPIQDLSLPEIENTPTGPKSPILQSKTLKNVATTPKLRDKKKCSDDWPTPEKKTFKLSFPTPTRKKTNGRLIQGRLKLTRHKASSVVDLTCSPEVLDKKCLETNLECNVKKEVIDDETILPSPTSGPSNFQPLSILSKETLHKFKIPVTAKVKVENETRCDEIDKFNKNNTNPLKKMNKYSPPKKLDNNSMSSLGDQSISLLQQVKMFEDKNCEKNNQPLSPSKKPLVENVNIVNVEKHFDKESSMSILRNNLGLCRKNIENNLKRTKPDKEPVYKEPTVRKKAEKKALPGWSCDQCRRFYDEMYKDNPEMLAKLMDECSRHRGRHDPVRPITPPGFWFPRWDVPTDTDEFNRRNDAL